MANQPINHIHALTLLSFHELDPRRTIRLTSPGSDHKLNIVGIVGRVMKLEQPLDFDDESLTFTYPSTSVPCLNLLSM